MEFIAKVDPETGQLKFATPHMKALYDRVLDFYSKSGTYMKFRLIEEHKQSTEGQHKLFERLCFMVVEYTGQSFKDVKNEFVKNYSPKIYKGDNLLKEPMYDYKKYEDMKTDEISVFIESCVNGANEFFDMNLQLYNDEIMGTILTSKKI